MKRNIIDGQHTAVATKVFHSINTHNHAVRVWDFDDGSVYVEVDKRRRDRKTIVANAHDRPDSKSPLYVNLRRGLMIGEPRMAIEGLSINNAKDARKVLIGYFETMGRRVLNVRK